MKKLLLLITSVTLGLQSFAFIPAKLYENNITLQEFLILTPKKYQEPAGKKMTFKEKILLKILNLKLRKIRQDDKMHKKNNFGALSLLFGMIAVVGLFVAYIPVLGFISLFGAIAAVILGIKGLRRNKKDTRSLIGLILGGTYLLLAIIFIAVIINFGVK